MTGRGGAGTRGRSAAHHPPCAGARRGLRAAFCLISGPFGRIPAAFRGLAAASRATAIVSVLLAVAACGDGERGEFASGGGSDGPGEIPDFNAAAAYQLLERQVGFGPRVPGTEGHRRQLEWMTEHLRVRADTVILEPFTHVTDGGDTLHLTNVFARFRPQAEDRVLLLAHWDSRPTADSATDPEDRDQPIPGANDGASGTAVLLQMADVLSSHSPPIGVDILLVDGEDYATGDMFLGSKHFAAHRAAGYRPLYGILVDMVGDRSPTFPIEPNSQNYAPSVVRRVWRTARELGYGGIFVERVGPAIQDDHIPLNEAGIPTIDIIDFEYGPGNRYWHTLEDDLQHTAPEGLDAVGSVLTALIYRGG